MSRPPSAPPIFHTAGPRAITSTRTACSSSRTAGRRPAALAEELSPALGDAPVDDLRGKLIVPGFVDSHIHFPQTDVIASYGTQLLDWLETHTFPAEMAFADRAHADEAAEFFLAELLRNGTTSALVFGSVHKLASRPCSTRRSSATCG
jgi:cytosine/adenosine deaminase-related metal-dependent hydrolase